MSADKTFTKENLDIYLKELGKEFRKYNGNKISAEIILIGGASILINYGFREITYDMDAIINSSGAMKLMAGRQYKNDLSDIVGILIEHEHWGESISLNTIKKAITNLYGSYECIPENSRNFIKSLYSTNDLKSLYKHCREIEAANKDILVNFQDDYPGILNGKNISYILKSAKDKKQHTPEK